jgi:2-dehydro-3-deoxygluconokinase
MDVVSIGETMILFSPEANGAIRYADKFSARCAGAESNTLIGLARLGHETGWISKVGKDELGEMILKAVRGEGVDTSKVQYDPEAPTGIFFKGVMNERDTRVYYYRKGSAASNLSSGDVDEAYIAQAKYLYLTGITPALSASCYELVFHAIEIAKKNHVKIVFDPNIRYKLWDSSYAKKTILKISSLADIVLPGLSEGRFIFGDKPTEKIAEAFIENGAPQVIVKLGDKGAYYINGSDRGNVPGFKVKRVVDPVGAGDGFTAGVLSGLLDGVGFRKAVIRGAAIGAIVVTANGDIEGLPDRETLERFIRSSADNEIDR